MLIETENAAETAERLRHEIEQMCIETQKDSIRISISIGLTTLQKDDDDLEMVTRRADKALYQAKEKGRNCVVVI